MNSNTYEVYKELKDLAPILAELPKKSVAEVPEGYFQRVEQQIMSQIFISESTDTPKLQVPDGYFERLESDVMQVISQNDPKMSSKGKTVWLPTVKFLQYAAAAVVILFASVWVVFNINNNEVISEDTALELETSDAYFEYLEDNIDEFDINILLEYDLIEESDIALITYTEDAETDVDQDLIFESEINF
jgi:hypothetical protein